uniref:Uncharacterized protein n=1 Tax=Panagrolaimus superbus TaxID=310955 RepID=A0A914Y7W4_9BILA
MHTNEFREVDTCDAEYGFNEYGKIKGRLIVREPGNRKFVREYTVTEATKNWRCLNCKIGIAKKNENGNFFVSTNHDCAAISYAIIQENQNLFEAKYKQLTNSPSKKVSRCESQMSKSSFNSSIISQNENGISNSTRLVDYDNFL